MFLRPLRHSGVDLIAVTADGRKRACGDCSMDAYELSNKVWPAVASLNLPGPQDNNQGSTGLLPMFCG